MQSLGGLFSYSIPYLLFKADIANSSVFTLSGTPLSLQLWDILSLESGALASLQLASTPEAAGLRALNTTDVLLLESNRTSIYRANFTSFSFDLIREITFR